MQNLVAQFERAGLDLKLLRGPFAGSNATIFQMDIQRDRASETFRLWPGQERNCVEVTSVDRKRSQLVLQVKEESQTFEDRLPKSYHRRPELGGLLVKVRENSSQWILTHRTPGSRRRYLCGMDEQHLFIAQFSGGTNVKAAHKALKSEEVREAERSGRGPAIRQGEWFFVRPTSTELSNLDRELSSRPYVVRKNASLGGNGRPHVADEVVNNSLGVYARGRVRHPEHKTLKLQTWLRVIRNSEILESTLGANGVYWID